MPPHVLLVGISTRAAAESAARAGFKVTTIDGFADLDQHPAVTAIPVPRGFHPRSALPMAEQIKCDAVAYLSNVDNDPEVVERLAQNRELWGNSPETLRRVRNPPSIHRALRDRGLKAPSLDGRDGIECFVVKPLASGGGRDVHFWHQGTAVPPGSYLQEYIEGAPGSVVFIAGRGRVSVLGISRQLIGLPSFGASGFRYCGSVLVSPSRELLAQARAVAEAITVDFGLHGLNGIDFIVNGDVLYPIEVNPRWTSSMELIERARGLSVFGAHAQACTSGPLPAVDAATLPLPDVVGKAIVFAREESVIGDAESWLADPTVRDVPRTGDRIKTGQPVCTVFATAADEASCSAALERRAASIYAQLATWTREAVA
jgi:predicted ATP-grasp superfamily ATP-dependent carboligase